MATDYTGLFYRATLDQSVDATNTPSALYTQWATAAGLPTTGTLLAMDIDDGAYSMNIGASPVYGGQGYAMFSSEAALGFYKGLPGTASTMITLANTTRMYAMVNGSGTNFMLLTWHVPGADMFSRGITYQKSASNTSVFGGQHTQYNSTTSNRINFAARIDPTGSWELAVQPIDVATPVTLWELNSAGSTTYNSTVLATVAINQTMRFTGSAPLSPLAGLNTRAMSGVRTNNRAIPAVAPRLAPKAVRWRDMVFGGFGLVSGTLAVAPATPVARRVRLFRERDGLMVRETWSDPVTGAYSFPYIDRSYVYTVVAYDYLHTYRAVVADNITPDPQP